MGTINVDELIINLKDEDSDDIFFRWKIDELLEYQCR